MASESPISLLKNLFLTFFKKIVPPVFKDYYKSKEGTSSEERAYRNAKSAWSQYNKASKSLLLSYASSVSSLVGVIGQPGVDAFNTWLATYAVGDGALTPEAIKALKTWYDQYLKPLS